MRADVAARDIVDVVPLSRAFDVVVVMVRLPGRVAFVVAVRALDTDGTDITPDLLTVARGITFDVVRADTACDVFSVVVRVPLSRTTTLVRAVVVRSRTFCVVSVFCWRVVARDIPDIAFARDDMDAVPDSPRFDTTVVAALRRVAARAISASSFAYAH